MIKKAATVIGFDDGFKNLHKDKFAFLIGVVYRLDHKVEGILSAKIKIDGFDSTQKIIKLVKNTKFLPQTKCIMLSGINFAGFNIVDIQKLSSKLKMPVIAVFKKRPNLDKYIAALQNLSSYKKRIRLIQKAGAIHSFNNVFFQCAGIASKEAKTIIKRSQLNSSIPEPLRLAHLIASGVALGQSTPP